MGASSIRGCIIKIPFNVLLFSSGFFFFHFTARNAASKGHCLSCNSFSLEFHVVFSLNRISGMRLNPCRPTYSKVTTFLSSSFKNISYATLIMLKNYSPFIARLS